MAAFSRDQRKELGDLIELAMGRQEEKFKGAVMCPRSGCAVGKQYSEYLNGPLRSDIQNFRAGILDMTESVKNLTVQVDKLMTELLEPERGRVVVLEKARLTDQATKEKKRDRISGVLWVQSVTLGAALLIWLLSFAFKNGWNPMGAAAQSQHRSRPQITTEEGTTNEPVYQPHQNRKQGQGLAQ